MSIYYKYTPDGTKIIVLSYVDDCVYWYTYKSPEKTIVDALEKRLHVNFWVYEHWFMSIRIFQMKNHTIYIDLTRYANFIAAKYLDTFTFKTITQVYNTTFPSDMIFTKTDESNSDDQVNMLTR